MYNFFVLRNITTCVDVDIEKKNVFLNLDLLMRAL